MDASTSKEFLKVYGQIQKLRDDVTIFAKEYYDASIVSYDEVKDAPENLSDFNNDSGFITEVEVDNKILTASIDTSAFLKKSGEESQECDIPTDFETLTTTTQDDEDSSTNVATTAFVHSLLNGLTEGADDHIIQVCSSHNYITDTQLSEAIGLAVGAHEYNNVVSLVAGEIASAVQQVNATIPTDTADLTNTAGYITLSQVPGDLVTSVNGQTGDVSLTIPSEVTDQTVFSWGYIKDAGVTSFNGSTGAVTYTAPVTSVNGDTGTVTVQPNVQANWTATSGLAQILNKPALKTVATTGSYNDLDDKPTLPTVSDISSWNNAGDQLSQVIISKQYTYDGYSNDTDYSTNASVVNISGRSLVWNQLVQNGNFTSTTGWTAADGTTLTVSGGIATIAPSSTNGSINQVMVDLSNHKCYVSIFARKTAGGNGDRMIIRKYNKGTATDIVDSGVGGVTTSFTKFSNIILNAAGTSSLNNVYIMARNGSIEVRDFIIIDLTQMFGTGNEPETAAEFEALFPLDYYDYNASTMICGTQTGLNSVDAGGNDIATVSVPITQLTGKASGSDTSVVMFPDGLKGIGDVKDEIDFAAGKAIKRIWSVDMDTLTWNTTSATSVFQSSNLPMSIPRRNGESLVQPAILVNRYTAPYYATRSSNLRNLQITVNAGGANTVVVKDTSYTTKESFQASVSGLVLHYELETPIEYDLDTTLDTIHDVKAGGMEIWLAEHSSTVSNAPIKFTGKYGVNMLEYITSLEERIALLESLHT